MGAIRLAYSTFGLTDLAHVKVPTTLLGYIDAALAIKSGLNFDGHKNRLGNFEPPLAVLLDRVFLKMLPERHVLNGVYEIIKLAIIRGASLLAALENDGPQSVVARFGNPAGEAIVDRAITGMPDELAPNLFEDGLACTVDFGHTFSYGLEARPAGHLLHGEAVLLDTLVSVLVARRRAILSTDATARVFGLLRRLHVTPNLGVLDGDLLWRSPLERVGHRNGFQYVPVPVAIGRCRFLEDVTRGEVSAAAAAIPAWLEHRREHV